jgi:hypothetical protein
MTCAASTAAVRTCPIWRARQNSGEADNGCCDNDMILSLRWLALRNGVATSGSQLTTDLALLRI